jgi:hypothetical protein
MALNASEQIGSVLALLPFPRTINAPIPLPFGAATSPIFCAVSSAIRNPYASDQNKATSRGSLAVSNSFRVSSSVINTGALLPMARGNFSDAAGFFSTIPLGKLPRIITTCVI